MQRRLLAALFLCAAALAAQDPTPPAAVPTQDPPTSRAAIQQQVDALRDDAALAPELKNQLSEVYGRALDFAKSTEANEAATRTFAEQSATAANRFQEVRAQLDEIGDPFAPTPGATLPTLEQELQAKTQALAAATTEATDREKESRRRAERRANVPAVIADRRKMLEALPEQLPDTPGTDPRLLTARRIARVTERAQLRSEIDALTAELAAYDAENELLRARRDLAERRAASAKAEVDAWQAAVQAARATAVREAVKEQAAEVENTPSVIVGLAKENARLALERRGLAERLAAAELDTTAARSDLDRLTDDYNEVTARVTAVGSTDAVGKLLRHRRTWLYEQSRQILRRGRTRDDRLADVQLAHFDIVERRQRMNRQLPRDWLQQELGSDVRLDDLSAEIVAQAESLRKKRQELLTALDDDYRAVLTTLTNLVGIEQAVSARLDQYRAFLAEHVLGIRSSPPVWQLDTTQLMAALAWLLDAREWLTAAGTALSAATAEVLPIVLLALLALLTVMRPWLQRRLVQHGDQGMRGSNVAYMPTLLALLDTCLLTAPLPALLWFLAWQLSYGDASEFAKALSTGGRHAAALLFLLSFLRGLVRQRGLGEAHFRWQTSTLKHLRRNLPILWPAVLLTFVLGALESRASDAWVGSLGTVLLLGTFAVVSFVAWRTLHPTTGLIGAAMSGRQTALHRFRRVWFVLGFGTPVTLLVMTALGYDYTVMQLSRRLLATVAVVVLGVLVNAFVVRGLVLERRRLQIRQAQERMAAARQSDGTAAGEATPVEEIDPQSLARQTQTLLRGALTLAVLVAAYQIWVDVLPALGILRRVELWIDDSNPAKPLPVTLADALLSLAVLILAVVSGRNVPALLELLVLQRIKMQQGERHAISTLAKYGIGIVGVLVAFQWVGIGWSKVQWLIAAISVGLGFGLQEIFANFVSGLILLFERPIRVGDIVSVGDVIGRVNRIRIRATTIQDWERKELVVPNREFVTGHFVNWTLTDSVVRWTIPVGVAYGSDTQRALDLLAEVAAKSPHVLREPRPEAVFVKFGDSTLDLQLRVFVDMTALDYRWMTELHLAIDRMFREAGIEIAFPQRDVNLKAAGPLLELIRSPARELTTTGERGAS